MHCIVLETFKTRYPWDQDGRFEYHKHYELKKVGNNFFMIFSFFTHRFFVKNLRKFISQIGSPLGGMELPKKS